MNILSPRICAVTVLFLSFTKLIDMVFEIGNGSRCGNVAAILELDEHLAREFIIFEAAPQESRGVPAKKPQPDYFL